MNIAVEKSLKRCLKRKITFTLGMMVAFLITGNLGYAEEFNLQDLFNNVEGNILELSPENSYVTDKGTLTTIKNDLTINGNGVILKNRDDGSPNTNIVAAGHKLVINDLKNIRLLKGTDGEEVENVNIEFNNSSAKVINGSYNGDVTNDIKITVKNSTLFDNGYILASEKGNLGGDVGGNVYIDVLDSTIERMIVAGAYGGADISGNTNVYVKGTTEKGTVVEGEGIYGGGWTYDGAESVGEVKGTANVTIDGNVKSYIVAGGGFNSGTYNDKGTHTNKTNVVINGDEKSDITYVLGGGYTNWFAPNTVNESKVILNSGNIREAAIGGRYVNGETEDENKKFINRVEKGEITLSGADVTNIYGGGVSEAYSPQPSDGIIYYDRVYAKTEVGNSKITITDGNVENIYGGGKSLLESGDGEIGGTPDVNSSVENTEILISGGTIKNNVFAGGYADASGVEGVKSQVGTSNIEISGGVIEGSIYAGGHSENNGVAQVTGDSTIIVSGGEIKGSIYGTGLGENSEVLGNSILNIDGYKNSLETISGFDTITISQATDMKVNNIILGKDEILTNAGKITLGVDTDNSTLLTINGGTAINNGTIVVKSTQDVASNTAGKFESIGSIQISDKTAEELKDFNVSDLFTGEYTFTGMLKDKDGNGVLTSDDEVIENKVVITDLVNEVGNNNNGEANIGEGVSIVAGEKALDVASLNIYGDVTIKNNIDKGVEIENTPINISGDKKIVIGEKNVKADLTITSGVVNGNEGQVAIDFGDTDSVLNLNNTTVIGNIGGDITNGTIKTQETVVINGDVTAKDLNVQEGTTYLDGNMAIVTINIGTIEDQVTTFKAAMVNTEKSLELSSDSKFTQSGTINIGSDGDLILNIGADKSNAFSNTSLTSDSVVVKGDNNGATTDLVLTTDNLSGDSVTIGFGNNVTVGGNGSSVTAGTDSDIYVVADTDKELSGNKNEITLKYNTNLFKDNSILNNMNNAASYVSGYFSSDVATREKQLDTLYANNIYSETARAAYDMMKLNEESVLSLNADAKVGEWVVAGKVLYNKTEYDRTGTIGKYTSEIETSGLMAGLEYGVNESTSVGVAISGAYQDIDTNNGEADGKLFYLGVYGKKEIGKLKLTAGLGYQYGDYDADNKVASIASSESYDVNAYSAYLEGRYGIDLGDNVTFEPKLKLGYTFVDQDNVSDDYFRLSDSELSTFDAEIGADLVKTVALKSGRLDVRFGASYVRAFGDTDDKFTGSFAGSTGNFEVLGAELSEDTAKFDLGVEVSKDSGIFYNLGGTLRVGSDNTRDYGVKLGAGYKF